MRISELMQHEAHLLTPDTELQEVAMLFRNHHINGVHVVDSKNKLLGVFTSHDLMKALAKGAALTDPLGQHVRDIICTVSADAELDEICWGDTSYLAVSDGQSIVGGLDASWIEQYTGSAPAHSLSSGWMAMLQFPDPMFHIEQDGSVCWCNYSACMLIGQPFSKIMNRNLSAILTSAGYTVDCTPAQTGKPEHIMVVRSDELHLATSSWSTTEGRQVLLFRNFREELTIENKLSRMTYLTKELKSVIDSSFDGFFITDGQGKVQLVNKAYERITGIRACEVLGKSMKDLVESGFYDESVTMQILETNRTKTIVQKVRSGKTIVVTGNPISDEAGNIIRVVTNVRDVTELRQLQRELEKISELKTHYKNELETLKRSADNKIIIRSQKMREVYDQALRLAGVDSTVLILGESGVGKEIMANAIHEHGVRSDKPFIKISCAAIPEQLLESELFGYVAGAFTGALSSGKPGLFELANRGTLFLDEVGELTLGLQSKLLRALQEKTITRVGGVQPVKVDVRIIAATNRDLETMVAEKQFRSDLYYRLNVVPLLIPPLREREEAIIDFLYHFLGKYNTKYSRSRQLESDAIDFMATRNWPGNVRELENAVERVVVMSHTEVISREDIVRILCKTDDDNTPQVTTTKVTPPADLKQVVENAERQAIMQALSVYKSSRKAAQALGVNQSTVVRKAKKLGINLCDA